MAESKDDTKYATAQARLSEDEAVRVRYKHGTPLEGGKIADSQPVDLFSSAHNLSKSTQNQLSDASTQAAAAGGQLQPDASGGNSINSNKAASN